MYLQTQARVPVERQNSRGWREPGGQWLGEGVSQYHNQDPLCRLIGPRNEVQVVMNDEVTGLVDSRAQISAVSMAFTKCHGLPIWQLQQLLDFEGFGRVDIPYIRYTQVQLKIPGIQDYDKDILVFIQKDSRYSEHVPIILGTLHIKDIVELATREKLGNLGGMGNGNIGKLHVSQSSTTE